MKRRQFLQLTSISPLLIQSQLSQSAETKPNIVLIYADDLGFGDVSCYGANDIHTPFIDRIADNGIRMSNWFSNSAVCSASRAALMTGRYPQRTGIPANAPRGLNDEGLKPSEITIAEALQASGYKTGISGKWHIGSTPECRPHSQGFDESYGFLSGCIDYFSHIMYWGQGVNNYPYHDLWRNNEEIWEDGEYMTTRITDEAIRFIRDHKENPFFLYVPYSAPHYPMHAPKEYFDRFSYIKEPQRRMQAAMVSALDDGIGRIYDDIERQGLMDNTWFIFMSDNGPSVEQRNLLDDSNRKYHGGSAGPYRGHKGSLFDGGIRVPAVMSWKGVLPEGKVNEELGVTMDMFPTIVNQVGGSIPTDRKIDGIDVFDMLKGNSKSPHETIYWGLGKQRAIRQGDWKFVLDGKLDFEETVDESEFLCNVKSDPFESKNLLNENKELASEMKKQVLAWAKEVGY